MHTHQLLLLAILVFSLTNCTPVNKKTTPKKAPVADDLLTLLDPNTTTIQQAFLKAKEALAKQNNNRALFYFVKVLQIDKENIQALLGIAAIHIKQDHDEIAEKVYLDILAFDENNATANLYIGLKKFNRRQLEQAKSHLNRVIEVTPNNWQAHNGLGVLADLSKDYTTAIEHYSIAIKSNRNSPMLLNNLGYSHYLNGDEIEAENLFNRALSINEKYQRAIFNLALIKIKNQQFDSANILFSRIMEDYESFNNIGYVCMIDNQFAAAESYFKKAISESPYYYPEAQENLKSLQSARFQTTQHIPVKTRPKTSVIPQSPPRPKAKTTKTKPAVVTKSIPKKTLAVSKKPPLNTENKAITLPVTTLIKEPIPEISVKKPIKKAATDEVKQATESLPELANTPNDALVAGKVLPLVSNVIKPEIKSPIITPSLDIEKKTTQPSIKINTTLSNNGTNSTLDSSPDSASQNKPLSSSVEPPVKTNIKEITETTRSIVAPITVEKEIVTPNKALVTDNTSPLISKEIKSPVITPSLDIETPVKQITDTPHSIPSPVVAVKETVTQTKTSLIDSIKKPIEPPETTSTESILKSIQMELERTTKQPLLLDTGISDQTNNIPLNKITEKKTVSEPELLDDN